MTVDDKRESKRARVRDALLPAIERELRAGVTYNDISIQSLVAEAKVSRSTFYSYFADKTDLLRACAEEVFTRTTESAAAWWDLGEGITYDDLHQTVSRAVSLYLPRAPLMAAVYDGARYDPSLRTEVEHIQDGLISRVEEHIRRGQKGGWVDPGLRPYETAAWITWMFERTQHQAMQGTDDEIDRLIRGGTAVLWRGLYAPVA